MNISAHLSREDRTYLEKNGAQLLALTKGRNIYDPEWRKEPGFVATMEEILELVKARGTYLRATADKRYELRGADFEKIFGQQYEMNVKALRTNGFVDAAGNIIHALDGEKYPLPAREQMLAVLESKRALLELKMEQGFGRLLLVPIGMKLNSMIKLTGEVLKKKQASGNLKYPGGTGISDEAFDKREPIFVNDTWKSRDEFDQSIYYAENFDPDAHGGMTKHELLANQTRERIEIPGWEVLVVEADEVLPKENANVVINGRKRIEANLNANQYLELLKTDRQYLGEKGLTLEAWLTQLLMSVSETGEVLDDWDGEGCATILLGVYNPNLLRFSGGVVGWARWHRERRQAYLRGNGPNEQDLRVGFRSAV